MVLDRDHYRCQICGQRAATVVHHIIPLKERPDLATEMSNLQSVCAICHNKEHTEKGNAKAPVKADLSGLRVIVLE